MKTSCVASRLWWKIKKTRTCPQFQSETWPHLLLLSPVGLRVSLLRSFFLTTVVKTEWCLFFALHCWHVIGWLDKYMRKDVCRGCWERVGGFVNFLDRAGLAVPPAVSSCCTYPAPASPLSSVQTWEQSLDILIHPSGREWISVFPQNVREFL